MHGVINSKAAPAPIGPTSEGFFPGLSEANYNALPHIRRSQLEWLGVPPEFRPDRYAYFVEHPEERPTFATAAYKSAYHARVNTPELYRARYIVVDKKTAALKEQHGDDFLLNRTEAAKIEQRYEALMRCDEVLNLLDAVEHFEPTGLYRCPWTGLLRKVRYDWYAPSLRTICDLKLVKSISDHEISTHIAGYGYHRQDATYMQGAQVLELPVDEFLFIFQEEKAPYGVKIISLTDEARAVAEQQVRAQMRCLQTCMALDEWAGPSAAGRKKIGLPRWESAETLYNNNDVEKHDE